LSYNKKSSQNRLKIINRLKQDNEHGQAMYIYLVYYYVA